LRRHLAQPLEQFLEQFLLEGHQATSLA
jgi:hypothetical protein